jgi:glycosyltransferase 2 family protein
MGRAPSSNRSTRQPAWQRWGKRIFTVILFVGVPVFLAAIIREVDWGEVKHGLGELKPRYIALAFLLGLGSYLVYSSYDLVGRWYTGHSLAAPKVLSIGFVCYAFTLNLGAWAGAFALRFRLYSRLGLDTPTVTKIFTLNIITNWSGYMLLAGSIFAGGLVELPAQWSLGQGSLRLIGFLLLLPPPLYLLACKYSRRRSWRLWGHKFYLPNISIALVQLLLSVANWSLMSLALFVLLEAKVSYALIMGGLLLSSIAGAITHIPAGLGVLETIFVTLLRAKMSQGAIVAALIGYRVVYYLVPLAVAIIVYLVIESRAKKMCLQESDKHPEPAKP